jgi:ribonuclease HI
MTIYRTEQLPDGICVLVDGGCRNNNLPVMERSMYGSLTVFHHRKQVVSRWGNAPELTGIKHEFPLELQDDWASNNLAELKMMENALTYIMNLKRRESNRPITQLTVVTDSALAQGFAAGTMKPNNKSHQALHNSYKTICAAMRELKQMGVEVQFVHAHNEWVKRILGH